MDRKETQYLQNDSITIYRTTRADNAIDTITLQQAIIDLAYIGPGGNGDMERRLKAGHKLENAAYIYCIKTAIDQHPKL